MVAQFIYNSLNKWLSHIVYNIQYTMVKHNTQINYNPDDLLEAKEIAAFLHVSHAHALKLIKTGKIKGGRLGKSFKAYFKYVDEYYRSILGGESIQGTLQLTTAPLVGAKGKKKAVKTKRP